MVKLSDKPELPLTKELHGAIAVVARSGEISSLWQFLKALFTFWQNLEPIFANFNAIGQIYIVIIGQILNNYLVIWSHWS